MQRTRSNSCGCRRNAIEPRICDSRRFAAFANRYETPVSRSLFRQESAEFQPSSIHRLSFRYQRFSTRRKVFVFVGGIHVIECSVSRKYFDIQFLNVIDLGEIMGTPLYVSRAYYTYIHRFPRMSGHLHSCGYLTNIPLYGFRLWICVLSCDLDITLC